MIPDARTLRRASLRATLLLLAAVATFAFANTFAAVFVASLALGTIPLSCAEIAARRPPRASTNWIPVVMLATLVIVAISALEAAYAGGFSGEGSLAAGVEAVADFLAQIGRPAATAALGTGSWIALGLGVASSLCAPFVDRVYSEDDVTDVVTVSVAAYIAVLMAMIGGALVGVFTPWFTQDTPLLFLTAPFTAALGAAPGCLLVPLSFALGDSLDERLAER